MFNHDPLRYLPRARVEEFPARYAIYGPGRPAAHLYLVLGGRIKIFCTAEDGTQTLLRIVPSKGFFGESSLVYNQDSRRESAVSLEPAQTMSWSSEQIGDHIQQEPKLGLALLQYFCGKNTALCERLVTISSFKTDVRVALGLLQLSTSIGAVTPQGAIRFNGLTHQAIADYVGTSREIVNSEMNRLRRLGYLEYSRRFTDIYVDALRESLRQQGVAREVSGESTSVRAAS